MIDQTSQKTSFVSPFFCCQMKGSTFFIFFSVFMIILHLYIPIISGLALMQKFGPVSYVEQSVASSNVYSVNGLKEIPGLPSINLNSITRHPVQIQEKFEMPSQVSQKQSIMNRFRILSQSWRDGHVQNSIEAPYYYMDKDYIASVKKQNNPDMMNHDWKMSHGGPHQVSYKYEDSELEWEVIDLIFVFTSCQQLFMCCFVVLCLIFFCMKHTAGNCMIYSFSISNLINSFIYILVVLFFFLVILFTDFVGQSPPTEDVIAFSSLSVIFFLVYGFNIFWGFLLLSVSRNVIPPKTTDESLALAQENLA